MTFRLILMLIFAAGCQGPGGGQRIIPEDRFAGVYADLLEVGQRGKVSGWDASRAQAAADSVLIRAGVTREEFQATVAWLNDDLTRWKSVSEKSVRILEERSTGRLPRP